MKESTSIILLLLLTLVIGQWIYLNGNTDYGFPLGLGLSIAYLIGKYTK